MDPYSSSGYRSDRAREQAKAFKTSPPAGGFLAPGFPVDTPPPPAVAAPGAGAAAGGFVGATVGMLIVGGYVGYKSAREVKKWDKYAKQPFYDAAKWAPKYSDDWSYPVGWDQEADFRIRQQTDQLIELKEYSDAYLETHPEVQNPIWVQPPQTFPGPGWWRDGYVYCECLPANFGINRFGDPNFAPQGFPPTGLDNHCSGDCSNAGGLYVSNFAASPASLAEPFGPLIYVNVYTQHATIPSRRILRADYFLVDAPENVGPWVQGTPGSFVQPAFQLASGDFTDADLASDNWLNAAALPGSYLSFDEQLVEDELGRGRDYHGWTVPFSLNHPFTVINVLPGSPPVTVPDVVIDPGTATDPGSVIIVPPGHNPFPDAGEAKQQKPTSQRLIHAGHVAINFATETNDLMQALAKGLPKKLRPKGPRGAQAPPWVILQAIWDHWDEFDSQVALEAFVNNQIEDAIYGRYFGLKAKAQRRLGISAGLARGVRGTPYTRKFSGTQTLVVPEVHFAHGQHSVTFGDYEINLVPR